MHVHILLKLLNKLQEGDKMQGLSELVFSFSQQV